MINKLINSTVELQKAKELAEKKDNDGGIS